MRCHSMRFNRLNWLLIPQHRFQNWGEKLVYVSIALIGSLFRNIIERIEWLLVGVFQSP